MRWAIRGVAWIMMRLGFGPSLARPAYAVDNPHQAPADEAVVIRVRTVIGSHARQLDACVQPCQGPLRNPPAKPTSSAAAYVRGEPTIAPARLNLFDITGTTSLTGHKHAFPKFHILLNLFVCIKHATSYTDIIRDLSHLFDLLNRNYCLLQTLIYADRKEFLSFARGQYLCPIPPESRREDSTTYHRGATLRRR